MIDDDADLILYVEVIISEEFVHGKELFVLFIENLIEVPPVEILGRISHEQGLASTHSTSYSEILAWKDRRKEYLD